MQHLLLLFPRESYLIVSQKIFFLNGEIASKSFFKINMTVTANNFIHLFLLMMLGYDITMVYNFNSFTV